MDGRIRFWATSLLGGVLSMVCAGCGHLAVGGATPSTLATTNLTSMTVQLSDLPAGFHLLDDATPTNLQLAQQLNDPASASQLDQLNRRAGTYRLFLYTMPEPSMINGPVQVAVEIDGFDTASHAQAWFADRQTLLTAATGAPLAIGAPGQRHSVAMTTYAGAGLTRTDSTLAFTEANVYVEITTVTVSQGSSLSAAEQYADLINTRLVPP